MSGLAVEKLLADLRARDVHVTVEGDRIRVDAPKGAITTEELAALRSRKAELRARLETETRLVSMSFEQYGRTNYVVELAVSWMREHLWLVPDIGYVGQLVDQGVVRGRIWTAAELTDLYGMDRLQSTDRRTIALLKAHFNTRIVSVTEHPPSDTSDNHRCRVCRGANFWRSIHGPIVCGICHPPATPKLVAKWLGSVAPSGTTS